MLQLLSFPSYYTSLCLFPLYQSFLNGKYIYGVKKQENVVKGE